MKKSFFLLIIVFFIFPSGIFAQKSSVGKSEKIGEVTKKGTSSVEILSEISGHIYLNNIRVGKVSTGGRIFLDGLDAGDYAFEIRSKQGSTKQMLKIGANEKRVFSVDENRSGIFWEGVAIKSTEKNFSAKSVGCRSNKFASGEKVVVRNKLTGQSLAMNVTGPSTSGNPDVLLELSPKAAQILEIGDTDAVKGNTVSVRRSFFWQELMPVNSQ